MHMSPNAIEVAPATRAEFNFRLHRFVLIGDIGGRAPAKGNVHM